MRISQNWLQTFFDAPLPDSRALADALTFHAFEIESIGKPDDSDKWDILDVKVTPNRGHDCLSHRGIAKEISAILNIPMKSDPLRESVSLEPTYNDISLYIDDDNLCRRYITGYIRGVKIGPSPAWLRENLESIGQKSINNIVDVANFVMFNIGQPLHAFDANRLGKRQKARLRRGFGGQAKGKSEYKIQVRNAKRGEKMTALDNKEYVLSESMLVIADGNTDQVIGIAGVKGGKIAEVNKTTTDIIIESANFDSVSVRKTAQALKLRTDASQRFEQSISPELALYGMRAVTDLILKIAGGELVGFADEYPTSQAEKQIVVSVSQVNRILGTALGEKEIADAFTCLGLPYKCDEASPHRIFMVGVPFERLDISIPEDLVEEIARIVGYDKIPSAELPPFSKKPEVNPTFYAAENVREDLISKGYSEVFTSVFRDMGEREVLNKIGGARPYLRTDLSDGLGKAIFRNVSNKDLLGLQKIKIFEIGTVWMDGKEKINIAAMEEEKLHAWGGTETILKAADVANEYESLPVSSAKRYQSFSKYPFIVRDIALWTATGTKPDEVLEVIRKESNALLVRSELFDTFQKAGKISYAFRLVFQSFKKTLTDEEANAVMENVYKAVKKEGWEVR